MKRIPAIAVLLALGAGFLPGWVESVEFPWNSYPKQLWERELVWMKNIGIMHVSLPPGAPADAAQLREVLRIVRNVGLEADLEGPVPEDLRPLTVEHGGPLTAPLPATAAKLSALDPSALVRSRELLSGGAPAILWTNVEDTFGASGFHAGAVNFAGDEKPATAALRRDARLSLYWARSFAGLHATPGAAVRVPPAPAGLTVRQFAGENGVSMLAATNRGRTPWNGALKAVYPGPGHFIGIPAVNVPAGEVLWLPVNVPLTAGPLCKDCTAFSNKEHLVYATAELTLMEYENGILAMEFTAPTAGEVVLELAHEPSGPYVAGGRPAGFDWDEHTQRARLTIPAGVGAAKHVRVGLAIEAPDATAFFDSARALMIGENNHLSARFSSDEIAQRSRLRTVPEFNVEQQGSKEPLSLIYDIKVPETAAHGDHADLALEADGKQMSHAEPQLLHPVSLVFPDAIQVRLAADSALPLYPAAIAMNRRTGRDFNVTLRNNAPEIRTFEVEVKAPGLDFSPARTEIVVGASAARDVSFRVFASNAEPGVHPGIVTISGAAHRNEPVQFVVIPQQSAIAWASSGVWMLESVTARAGFIPGRWLEFLNKTNNQNLIGNSGAAFTGGAIELKDAALVFGGQRTVRMEDLDALAAAAKRR
jgi:hypothetical protein